MEKRKQDRGFDQVTNKDHHNMQGPEEMRLMLSLRRLVRWIFQNDDQNRKSNCFFDCDRAPPIG